MSDTVPAPRRPALDDDITPALVTAILALKAALPMVRPCPLCAEPELLVECDRCGQAVCSECLESVCG